MRKFIVKLLFRLLESGTIQYLSIPDKTVLRKDLARLYKEGIISGWLQERESIVMKRLKIGVKGEEYLMLRGMLLEQASINNEIREYHLAEEKARKIADIKNKQNQSK